MKLKKRPIRRVVSMSILFAAVGGFGLAATAVASSTLSESPAPVVNGNTITVEPDGWYQFQRADNFVEVCAGTYVCTVTPGSYIVINHTTQQRWEPVVVGGGQLSEPQVVGNRIVLADDGWYQVQDGQTYASLCEGASFCEVPPGSYIVINHTSGQRFESVMVGSEAPRLQNLEAVRYSDSAGEIFWQRVESDVVVTYQLYRDGVSIGETTGTSFFDDALEQNAEYLYAIVALETGAKGEVALDARPTEQAPPVNVLNVNVSNAQDILKQVVSVINEDKIDNLFAKAQADLKFQDRLFFLTNTTDQIMYSQGIALEAPYQLETNYGTGMYTDVPVGAEYVCAAGGTINNFGGDRVFNNCSVGEHTYTGTIGRRNDQLRGTIRRYPFYSFSAIDAVGGIALLSGGYYTGNLSFVSLNRSEGWDAGEFIEITADGVYLISDFTIERKDTSYNERSGVNLADGSFVNLVTEIRNSTIEGSFQFATPQFDSLFSVTVSLAFADSTRTPVETDVTDIPGGIESKKDFQWETGSIEVVVNDGSGFTVFPTSPPSQSFIIELNNGESIGPIAWDGDYVIDCGSEQICP